jgi:hypothetical protein
LIPKAIAVVEMDVTETSVLKLFDQSIVSCEFVNELCPHLRPLHREDSSVFTLRLYSDVVTLFQKNSSRSSANPTRFTFDGTGVTTPAVAGVVEEDVAALKMAPVADVTPASARLTAKE